MERRDHRRKRRDGGGRRQSLFSARGGEAGGAQAERIDLYLSVERRRALFHRRRWRKRKSRRRLDLSRSQAGGGADQGPHRLLEGRAGFIADRPPCRRGGATSCPFCQRPYARFRPSRDRETSWVARNPILPIIVWRQAPSPQG